MRPWNKFEYYLKTTFFSIINNCIVSIIIVYVYMLLLLRHLNCIFDSMRKFSQMINNINILLCYLLLCLLSLMIRCIINRMGVV